ncbi:hypothetical protein SETIT_J004000v2 [Setaria italica]|uniref:Terpene synthase N-terminal domain-containing protein n=1 Tax=Setaria italica TaxID=4555 RepID=K3Z2E9_SETIT|nr:hypothetical protein SETIT_J004000v2 [Setaria italica]
MKLATPFVVASPSEACTSPNAVCAGEHAQAAVESPHWQSANYEPTTWDYDSICSSLSQQPATTTLKERVRRLLVLEEAASASSRLRMIHQLQSLGIAYHFEEEIEAILLSIHHTAADDKEEQEDNDLDLHSAALLFRMPRLLHGGGPGAPARTKPAPPTPGRSSTRRCHLPRIRTWPATCASTLPGSSTASTRTRTQHLADSSHEEHGPGPALQSYPILVPTCNGLLL